MVRVEGAKMQILDEEGQIVEEWVTGQEAHNKKGLETEKEYILHEAEPAKGYVTAEDIKFSINTDGSLRIKEEDQIKEATIPTIQMKDARTKIKINIIDKETKEPVKDVVIQIIDKTTGEVVYEFTAKGEEEVIEKLPIGEYEIVEKEIPIDKGYVTFQKQDLTVQDTPQEQEKTIEQDHTKLDISLLDEIAKEMIAGGKLEIRNEQGETVATIDNTGVHGKVDRLPIGEYTLVEVETPEGYETAREIKFKIEDTAKLQYVVMENKRLPFDLKVEKYTSEITVNGVKQAGTDDQNPGKVVKIDINAKKIASQKVEIRYKIKITNTGKVAGTVGKIVDTIPSGLSFKANKNQSYWKEEGNNTITTTQFADKKIQPGESMELEMLLDWDQNSFNFGQKANVVTIGEFSNVPGFGDEDGENNIAKAEILLSIKTGEAIVIAKQILAIIIMTMTGIGILALIEIKVIEIKSKKVR